MGNLIDGVTDLRSGTSLWQSRAAATPLPARPLERDLRTDVIVVGAGITGSFVAERLTQQGHEVVIVDRHAPQHGSTAASTALLQWELDAPLLRLEQHLGFEQAAKVYRLSRRAVDWIGEAVTRYGIACGFTPRSSLYLAGRGLDAAALREELRLRRHAGLDGTFLDEGALAALRLRSEAALRHDGSAEADPMALAAGLLSIAVARGARLLSPVVATAYDATADGVIVATDGGQQIGGRHLVLANGYEIPEIVPSRRHRIVSTWALATPPVPPDRLWPEGSLVWEASDPYHYLRTTPDGRVIVGGEDEDLEDPRRRDALLPAKQAALLDWLSDLLPGWSAGEADYAWAGFFGTTEDALPLIGPVPGLPGVYAAFGYGGNGITFSAIAADRIARMIAGETPPDRDIFAVDR